MHTNMLFPTHPPYPPPPHTHTHASNLNRPVCAGYPTLTTGTAGLYAGYQNISAYTEKPREPKDIVAWVTKVHNL